ncbi:hypothetical protein MRB53_041721 [Persea americana]|nr:hypothetical protein MRB53_041721 [Persea americana]
MQLALVLISASLLLFPVISAEFEASENTFKRALDPRAAYSFANGTNTTTTTTTTISTSLTTLQPIAVVSSSSTRSSTLQPDPAIRTVYTTVQAVPVVQTVYTTTQPVTPIQTIFKTVVVTADACAARPGSAVQSGLAAPAGSGAPSSSAAPSANGAPLSSSGGSAPTFESGAFSGGPTLLPAVHWEYPVDDIRNLAPVNSTDLYYSENGVSVWSSVRLGCLATNEYPDPNVQHLFASISTTLQYEAVILDHSIYVASTSAQPMASWSPSHLRRLSNSPAAAGVLCKTSCS